VCVVMHMVLQLALLQSAMHLSLVVLQVATHVFEVLMHVTPQPASSIEAASDTLASERAPSVARSLAESTAAAL